MTTATQTTHTGDLIITSENVNDPRWQTLIEMTGNLYINADNFAAPALQTVGNLYIRAENTTLPALQTVRYLEIRANNFTAPSLQTVGNLHINADNATFSTLQTVGNLYINADNATFSTLQTVGNLYIRSENTTLPSLQTVGRYLEIRTENTTLPNLTSIEGEVTSRHAHIPGLRWSVLKTDKYIRIGCQRHTIEEWAGFTDETINTMADEALAFWKAHKAEIMAL